ncbi:MAG TPA: hypothetical protein VEB60_00415 [Candidatus Paceibacterota bacterium]|nr:hypothetical protein [Candidatus Paceibacterota bacterium]
MEKVDGILAELKRQEAILKAESGASLARLDGLLEEVRVLADRADRTLKIVDRQAEQEIASLGEELAAI